MENFDLKVQGLEPAMQHFLLVIVLGNLLIGCLMRQKQ